MRRDKRIKIIIGVLVLAALGAAYWMLHRSGGLATIIDGPALRAWIAGLGVWGPLAVIGLMILAILVSPIPSAPIALAAGASFGHIWGTLYVLIGSEAGALAAFALARLLGRDALRRWFGDRFEVGLLGSQNGLMGLVFISRLLPFISFDVVSYAAGLTGLAFWRFAVATLAGIIPASFLIAHMGSEMAGGDGAGIMISILIIGTFTLIPLAIKPLRDRFAALRERRASRKDGP